jgi:hypothetical protein
MRQEYAHTISHHAGARGILAIDTHHFASDQGDVFIDKALDLLRFCECQFIICAYHIPTMSTRQNSLGWFVRIGDLDFLGHGTLDCSKDWIKG